MDTIKNIFLDLTSMIKGFAYGFFMVGLFILIAGGLLYGVLFLRNLLV